MPPLIKLNKKKKKKKKLNAENRIAAKIGAIKDWYCFKVELIGSSANFFIIAVEGFKLAGKAVVVVGTLVAFGEVED